MPNMSRKVYKSGTFFARCFKENLGKLYIMIVKLIAYKRYPKVTTYFAIFDLVVKCKPLKAKLTVLAIKLKYQPYRRHLN